jgi:hypothetical protein
MPVYYIFLILLRLAGKYLEPELGKLMVKKGKQLQPQFLFTKAYVTFGYPYQQIL